MPAGSSPHIRERLVASAAVASGALITIGAFLPWLSLFAGLHPMRGVIGLYGRLVAGGGIGCVLAGVAYWRRPARGLRWTLAVLGWVLAGVTIWLTAQLLVTYRELRTDPLLVPQLGPGLFLALGGSLAVGAALALRLAASGRSRARPRSGGPVRYFVP